MTPIKQYSIATCPGKIILFGEHFVVYDNPAILAAIDRRIKVVAKITDSKSINISSDMGVAANYDRYRFNLIRGDSIDTKSILDPLYKSIVQIIDENKLSFGIDIEISSQIPPGIGLGSSAASCLATIAAVNSLFYKTCRQEICTRAIQSERFIHQNSSGADCYISTFGGIIQYSKSMGFKSIQIKNNRPIFILVNTGIKHSTGKLVSSVREFKDSNQARFEFLKKQALNLYQNALLAIKNNDLQDLGMSMVKNQEILAQLGVSNDTIETIVTKCLDNGAYGAKLTGAGGGGAVIALVPDEKILYDIVSTTEKDGYECFPINIDFDGLLLQNT